MKREFPKVGTANVDRALFHKPKDQDVTETGPQAPRKKWSEPDVSRFIPGSLEERDAKRAIYAHGPVVIIDADTRRRAEISYMLAKLGIHSEPIDDPKAVLEAKFRFGAALVADEGCVVEDTLALLDDAGISTPVVAFSTSPSLDDVVAAIRGGAFSYFEWPNNADEIVKVFREVIEKSETFRELGRLRSEARSKILSLSRREREIMHYIMHGASNREIGEVLSISPRTVEIHRANIVRKLKANNTAEAIRIAFEASVAMRDLRSIYVGSHDCHDAARDQPK